MTLVRPSSRYHQKLSAIAEGLGYSPGNGLRAAEQFTEHLSRAGYRIISSPRASAVAGPPRGVRSSEARDAGAAAPR